MKTKHTNRIVLWLFLGLILLPGICLRAQHGEQKILLKARIVEVSQSDREELGLEWSTIDAARPFLDMARLRRSGLFPRVPVLDDEFPSLDGMVNQGRSIVIPDGSTIGIDTDLDTVLDSLTKLRTPTDPLLGEPRIPTRNGNPIPLVSVADVDFDYEELPVHVPTASLPYTFDELGLNLSVSPRISTDGLIEVKISTQGSYFLKDEKTVDLFAGAALGDDDENLAMANNVNNNNQFTQNFFFQDFVGDLFAEDAGILGMRFACFHGYYFGLGTTVQYIDGEGDGAWSGEFNGILRFPIETPKLGIAPYVIGGLGGLFADETLSTASLGGGVELRTDSRYGLFVEGRYIWTEDDLLNHTAVTAGIRILTDGIGPRRVTTRVLVDNGQTAVIGGLFQNSGRERKIPILGDLPVLSQGFRKRSDYVGERNLLIFVKPRTILMDEASD